MHGLFIGASAVLGLAVGSFLNVVAYRVPRHLPFANERSQCPNCGHQLRARDLIPVFSWIILKGKCRDCHTPIHWRYPLVESLTGIAFGMLANEFGFGWVFPAYFVFAAGLIVLSDIDFEFYIIPNRILYPIGFTCLGLLTLAAAMTHDWHSFKTALAGGFGAWLFLLIIHLISPAGMGFGDVRLSALLGLMLGWITPGRVFVGILFGFVLGSVTGIVLMATKKATRKTAIPFGPFLAMGAYIAIFVGFSNFDKVLH